MVAGTNQGFDPGTTDWLNKASPDQLVTQATAVISKIGSMDQSVQDRFVQQLRADPAASRLFEKIGSYTG
jgi:hypothetical protein